VVLTLCSHLMVTFGFPLPARSRKKPTDGIAYPCQSRPCGCLNSDQCWKGDCCCFSIEEKLAWAEANGVEPPEHVRSLVESRRSRPAPLKKKSCYLDAEPERTVSAPPTCCEKQKPAASCCGKTPTCGAESVADCRSCTAKSASGCCEKKNAAAKAGESGVRWVVGIFAQKCRGEGPGGLYQPDPAVVPDLAVTLPPAAEPPAFVRTPSERSTSIPSRPPTPPPKQS
jgi:hypothetical protein